MGRDTEGTEFHGGSRKGEYYGNARWREIFREMPRDEMYIISRKAVRCHENYFAVFRPISRFIVFNPSV